MVTPWNQCVSVDSNGSLSLRIQDPVGLQTSKRKSQNNYGDLKTQFSTSNTYLDWKQTKEISASYSYSTHPKETVPVPKFASVTHSNIVSLFFFIFYGCHIPSETYHRIFSFSS